MCKFEKSYAEALRAGEIEYNKIDDYIEYWHNHDTGNSLQDFLGMTKTEFYRWVKYGDRYIFDILGIEVEPPEIPVCKMCNRELGVRTPAGIICSSSYIEDNDYCHECQVEHCVSTNCLKCEIGTYPDCKHMDLKKWYMQNDEEDGDDYGD